MKMPTRSSSRNPPAPCGPIRPATRRSPTVRCAFRGRSSCMTPNTRSSWKGVRRVGYSTILMGGVRDPYILAQIDSWLAQLDDNIKTRVRNTVGERAYEIVTRVYGRDGVMGALEPQRGSVGGHEAFILWDVISESQELSRTIATSLSHLAVHNPIPKWHGLISGVAFPYSPPEIDRGPVYEFHLNHVLVPDSPTALFRTEYEEV